ncbi:hypothetical protein FRC11_013687, partial [Ceratobasidium sp. 423]
MSRSHTPTSDVSTSSSSRSSCRRLDSNTTPSPTGGSKSPMVNPRALSNRLAMLEASQALAQASATLSIAAQAMSRAAASLAAVSDYGDEEYTFEDGGLKDVKDWAESPDWTQSSYNLAPIQATSDKEFHAVNLDEGYKLAKTEELAPIEEVFEAPQPESPSESEPGASLHPSEPAPVIEVSPPAPQEIIIQASAEVPSGRFTSNLPTGTTSAATETSRPAIPLLNINGLADSPNIQLVHIGEPSEPNTAKSGLNQIPKSKSGDYILDVLNDICNQQGPKSPLQPFREWLRSHLSQDTNARTIYWDWVLQRRKQDPSLGPVKIVRLANQFAEEFLLRGGSTKYGNPVGGQVTIAESTLKGLKMGPAVQAGVLL